MRALKGLAATFSAYTESAYTESTSDARLCACAHRRASAHLERKMGAFRHLAIRRSGVYTTPGSANAVSAVHNRTVVYNCAPRGRLNQLFSDPSAMPLLRNCWVGDLL